MRVPSRPRKARIVGTVVLVCVCSGLVVGVGRAQTQSAAAPDASKAGPAGTLQQLMRGVFFPASNMIFNVQTHDPADKKPGPAAASGSDVDLVKWGAGLYSGWEDVDYAAVALAEVTPLLLTPGRTCQNGKPVPVARADWVKYTNDMLLAARKAYAAARARNRDAVSDATNDLSDACQACHSVYRDRRPAGVGPGDPAATAIRCTAP